MACAFQLYPMPGIFFKNQYSFNVLDQLELENQNRLRSPNQWRVFKYCLLKDEAKSNLCKRLMLSKLSIYYEKPHAFVVKMTIEIIVSGTWMIMSSS